MLLSGRSLHRETDAEPGRVLLAANGGVVPTGRNEPRPSPALLGARRGGLRLGAAARAGRALAVRGAGLFPHALPCGVSFRVADPRLRMLQLVFVVLTCDTNCCFPRAKSVRPFLLASRLCEALLAPLALELLQSLWWFG